LIFSDKTEYIYYTVLRTSYPTVPVIAPEAEIVKEGAVLTVVAKVSAVVGESKNT
jgi:hypothetical protein